MQGIVKWFNNKKGFGFIAGEDNKDYFVYFSDIKMDGFKTIKYNQQVSFNGKDTEKGPQAFDVVPGEIAKQA